MSHACPRPPSRARTLHAVARRHKIEEYLSANHDEYVLYLRKYATHTMRPACELVGCKEEGSFLPNAAGWSIYKRVDATADGSAAPPVAAAQATPTSFATPILPGKHGGGRRIRKQAAKAAAQAETGSTGRFGRMVNEYFFGAKHRQPE